MSLANDLMGYGLPAQLALSIAEGGSGPLTPSSAGSAFASATRLKCGQALVSVSDTDGTKGVSLPIVGGLTGVLIADAVVINNSGTTSLPVFGSSGVTISAGGTNTSVTTVGVNATFILYPISTSAWIGVKGT